MPTNVNSADIAGPSSELESILCRRLKQENTDRRALLFRCFLLSSTKNDCLRHRVGTTRAV